MEKRQPKTRSTTSIEVVGRPGGHKGRIELTSGNLIYFRQGAQIETLRLTYQQLMTVLERELEYQSIDPKKVKFPKSHKDGDFTLELSATEDDDTLQPLLSAQSSITKLDPRRVDLGTYQFSNDMVNGRASKKYKWFANVSIQAALWIINRYVDKFLTSRKMSDHTDKDVVISKQKMREIFLVLFKKVDSPDTSKS